MLLLLLFPKVMMIVMIIIMKILIDWTIFWSLIWWCCWWWLILAGLTWTNCYHHMNAGSDLWPVHIVVIYSRYFSFFFRTPAVETTRKLKLLVTTNPHHSGWNRCSAAHLLYPGLEQENRTASHTHKENLQTARPTRGSSDEQLTTVQSDRQMDGHFFLTLRKCYASLIWTGTTSQGKMRCTMRGSGNIFSLEIINLIESPDRL